MAAQTINRPDSPSSDTESVVSSVVQPPSRLGLGELASANYSSLNLSSLGLGSVVVASSSKFTPDSSLVNGFNGISTVLNNPRKKQHAIDPRSSRWPPLPAHKEAEIVRPPKQTVQTYIDEVSSEWERYTRNRDLGSRGKAKTTAEATSGQGEGAPRSQEGSKGKLPPISAIPQVFFDDEFNLGNPYTFDIVTEKYGSANAVSGSASSSSDQKGPVISGDHVEKLSHYSDLVEQHLLHEIATRSGSFFSALGALQDLAHSSTSCLSLIRTLRSDLISISDNQVRTGLKIVRKQDERRGIIKQIQAVEQVRAWCEGKRMAELMVGQGEYDEALLVIESLQVELQSKNGRAQAAQQTVGVGEADEEEQTPLASSFATFEDQAGPEDDLDLSKVPAIAALAPDLEDLKASITVSLEAELASVLQGDLDPQNSSASPDSSWPLRNRVQPLLESLIRTQGLEKALTTSYRPIALASIRSALEASLPSATEEPALAALFDLLDDDIAATGRGESRSGEAGANAARRLRELSADEFQPLLLQTCNGLEEGLKRVERQKRGILSILDAVARQTQASASDSSDRQEEMSDFIMPPTVTYALPALFNSQLQATVEVAHILVARLISLRAFNHAQLELSQFLSLFTPLMEFAERTEKVSLVKEKESTVASRRLVPLRSTLLNQAKEWLRYFHRVRLEKAARWVEEETWAQVDVSVDSVKVLQTLIAAATEDPVEWLIETSKSTTAEQDVGSAPTAKTLVFPSEASNGTVDGDEKSYYMVPATLRVLGLTQEYMQTVVNFEKVGTTEIMSRVVEFLKQFNSRTCQVVLGAGAMRSAGLKNITAKHLALASQSLSLFIHLIPYLRECVRRHLPDERQAVMLVEFDKLKRDFQEHQYEIHAKLVAIMGDRLGVHCRGLASTSWNAPLPSSAEDATAAPVSASKPISDLIKETTTLHKVLSKYLQSSVVEAVFTQVLEAIIKRVGVEFARVEVTREGGNSCQTRMKADVEQLDQKLGSLKGAKWDSTSLRAIVTSKTPPPAMAPVQAPAARAPISSSSDTPSTPARSGVGSASATSIANAGTPHNQSLAGESMQTPRAGPAPYKSKFSFGRRGGGTPQQSPLHQQSGSPQFQSGGNLGPGSPLGTPRLSSQVLRSESNTEGSQRGSIDVVALPAAQASTDNIDATEAIAADVKEEEQARTSGSTTEVSETVEPTAMSQMSAEKPTEIIADGPAIGAGPAAESATEAQVITKAVSSQQPPKEDVREPEEPDGQAPSTTQALSSVEGDTEIKAASVAGAGAVPSPVPLANPTNDPTKPSSPDTLTPQSPPPSLPTSIPTSGTNTPTKTTRMTLQQRLAEAARKRAAAAPPPPPPPPPPGIPVGAPASVNTSSAGASSLSDTPAPVVEASTSGTVDAVATTNESRLLEKKNKEEENSKNGDQDLTSSSSSSSRPGVENNKEAEKEEKEEAQEEKDVPPPPIPSKDEDLRLFRSGTKLTGGDTSIDDQGGSTDLSFKEEEVQQDDSITASTTTTVTTTSVTATEGIEEAILPSSRLSNKDKDPKVGLGLGLGLGLEIEEVGASSSSSSSSSAKLVEGGEREEEGRADGNGEVEGKSKGEKEISVESITSVGGGGGVGSGVGDGGGDAGVGGSDIDSDSDGEGPVEDNDQDGGRRSDSISKNPTLASASASASTSAPSVTAAGGVGGGATSSTKKKKKKKGKKKGGR